MTRIWYIILIICMAFPSCNKDALDTYHPKIVVYCILETGSFASARIEYTQNILDTTLYRISSPSGYIINPALVCSIAKVAIFENGTFVDSLLFNSTTSLYEGRHHKTEAGGNYKMEVTMEGQPLVYATTRVPNMVKIVSIDTAVSASKGYDGSNLFGLSLTFSDPAMENNYYEITGDALEKQDTMNLLYSLIFASNALIENINLYYGRYLTIYFSDKLINGKKISLYLMEGDYDSFHHDSIVYFNLANVSVEKAKYTHSVEQHIYNTWYGSAFSEPVTIYSNIVNGVGVFGSKTISKDSITF